MKVSQSSKSGRVSSRREVRSATSTPADVTLGGEMNASLAESLTRIVADPARADALHALLGPYCHESRNILNSLKMSLYLTRRKPPTTDPEMWAEVDQSYRSLEQFFDRLQTLWRPLPLCLVQLPLSLLMEERREVWVEQFALRGRSLRMSAMEKAEEGQYDPNCLGMALDAFVGWRATAGVQGQEAALRWWTRNEQFTLEWIEPRPLGEVAEESTTTSESPGNEPLALPLLGRVVAAHGGTMELLDRGPGGYHLRICWPQFTRRPA